MQRLIVIEGPTASGKTALAVALAKELNTVVISADSRQFYQEMTIGTAKPSKEEMCEIPHYFIDSHSILTPVTASCFEKEALALLRHELAHLQNIILVGGSGMFIDALCVGLDPIPADENTQIQLRAEFSMNGLPVLLEELKRHDPDYYAQVDKQNPMRILRALEVIRFTKKTYTEWRANAKPERPFDVLRFVINHPREKLYDRINLRVDQMIQDGLFDEVKSLGNFRNYTALQTVGYKEVFDYFDGTYDQKTCIEKIKQHTRNYAKRQLTWFKKHPESHWLKETETQNQVVEILQVIQKQGVKTLE